MMSVGSASIINEIRITIIYYHNSFVTRIKKYKDFYDLGSTVCSK